MQRIGIMVLIGSCLGIGSTAQAQEPISVAVMDFASKGGVTQEQMDALGDMLANEIRSLGNIKVIGKSDIKSALQFEEQKSLLGCSETSCMAELGGALGVRWLVAGNISLFGQTYLMNLKLMDAQQVRVANAISRTVKGEQDNLIEALPGAVRELFSCEPFGAMPSDARSASNETPATGTDPLHTATSAPAEEVDGWFGTADLDGLFLTLAGGATLFTGNFVNSDGSWFEGLDSEKPAGGGLYARGGYTFFPWLSAYAGLGFTANQADAWPDADLGSAGGLVLTDASTGYSERKRTVLDVVAGARLRWPLAGWIQPVAQVELGYSRLSDDGDLFLYRSEQDSFSNNSIPYRIEAGGLAFNIGLGVEFYFTRHWLVGLETYFMLRLYPDLDLVKPNLRDSGPPPGSSNKAILTGGGLLLSTGWHF